MSNGEMLAELQRRAAAADPDEVVTAERFGMALASMVELKTQVAELSSNMSAQFNQIMAAIELRNISIEQIKDDLLRLNASITTCEHCTNKALVERVKSNPAVLFGAWIRDDKKSWAILGAIGIIILIFLAWWLDPTSRQIVFEFLHFPTGLINALAK